MRTLKEALISKSNRDWASIDNKYGITEKDLVGELKGFPLGVVVRMLEEQERQGHDPDVTVFQNAKDANHYKFGFNWNDTDAKIKFWENVILYKHFDKFFKKYPEYKKYNK